MIKWLRGMLIVSAIRADLILKAARFCKDFRQERLSGNAAQPYHHARRSSEPLPLALLSVSTEDGQPRARNLTQRTPRPQRRQGSCRQSLWVVPQAGR